MSDLYKTAFRGYLIDHHSPDPPVVTLEKLDAREYETFFREAHINSLLLYCKDHWGSAYYDTKVGKKHPALRTDWIRELRPVLRRGGIEFTAYYCLEYDTYAPVAHPEWAVLQADGTPLTCQSPIAHWKMPCYETGYRQYALGQIREIAEGYAPDSLFLDIFGKSLCYCPVCRAKFERQYGYPLPEDPEGLAAHVKDVNDFLDAGAKSMLQDIKSAVAEVDPTIKVTINFSALYRKDIRDMLDYQFTEPFAGNWLSAAYARDTAVGQYPQLGPGDVSEVYNYKSEAVYQLAAAEIAAQGCRVFMYSGSQHPDGTLEHEEARRVGAAYREVEKFEKYLQERQVVADIAIIQSDTSTTIHNDFTLVPNAIGRAKQGSSHRDAVVGAMRMCDASGYTWKIVPEQEVTPENLARFRLVMLPDVFCVTDALRDAITGYVTAGGRLLLSGLTGMFDPQGKLRSDFALAGIMGASYIDTVDTYRKASWGGYLAPSEDPLLQTIRTTFAPVSSEYYRVRPTGGRALTHFVYPAVQLTGSTWVNWWNPPPKTETNDPAFVQNRVGAGQVLYAAFDLMRMANDGFHYVEGLFRTVADAFIQAPTVRLETENPHAVGFVAYDRPAHSELIVHEVSHIAAQFGGDTPAIGAGTLRVSLGRRQITGAELVYPAEKPLPLEEEDGCAVVRLPDIRLHQIIRLTYQER